jgi:rare lipoprotein A
MRSYNTQFPVETSDTGLLLTLLTSRPTICGTSLDVASRTWRVIPFLAAVLMLSFCGAACGHRPVASHAPAQTPEATTPAAPPSGPPPATERQPAVPDAYVEEGVASWYGLPFHGRRTSNGEVYDMHEFTAAHRTLPFGAVVRVTNLRNGKQTEVRINDRGPFVANRVIDLSLSAAQAIEMVGPGTAPVRLEVLAGPSLQAGFFAVQVGAFLSPENADRLRGELAARYSTVSVVKFDSPNGLFYRVRVGRFATEDAARQLADQLHSNEQFTTFVVRLDE